MSWYKVTLSVKDYSVKGKGSQLRNAFKVILVANGSRPVDAAVFAQTSDDYESVYFYFSPAACQLAPVLVEQFHGVPCSGPPFVGKSVALEIGDARAWDLLGVNKPAGL